MDECEHLRVTRATNGEEGWKCLDCDQKFWPEYVLDNLRDHMAEASLVVTDATAAVASAMLWDFHERAVEHYGNQVAASIQPSDDKMFAFQPEECPHHEFTAEQCVNCGAAQFLGS